ncbi:MAG: hypothetical protein RIG77_16575 [Cyclobacteriaceae bacterium]
MSYQTIDLELMEYMKSLNANQKDDVLSFVKKISSQNFMRRRNRKNALKEIKAALKGKKF